MDFNILQRLFSPKQRFVWHIVFWIAILMMFTGIDVSEYSENWQKILLSNFLGLPVMMMATYLTLYGLLPIFLIKKTYNQFFVLFILSAFGFGLLQRGIAQYVIFPFIWDKYLEDGWFVFYKIAFNIINIYVVVLAAVAVKLLKIALQNEYARQLLEKEKLKAELKFLKSQIHPHFLFNTLNNLYALTLKNSTKAPEVVLKLSSLLDYMLFESNVSEVPLAKEISLINNYISLEKMRYGEALEVSFNFSIDTIEREISPLLFFPFVEYAFQQSLVDNSELIWITIDLEIKNDILILKIENAKLSNADAKPDYESLKNVQRRLKLLYPNKQQLKLLDTEETHLIILSLELT
jgi:sensor histidine kinase YesM